MKSSSPSASLFPLALNSPQEIGLFLLASNSPQEIGLFPLASNAPQEIGLVFENWSLADFLKDIL